MAEQAEQRRAGQIEESHYVDAALAVTILEAGPADTAFLGYLYRARVDVLENFLARRIAKQRSMDQILNVGFFVFHSAWILFNCVGWMWRRTRPWQLATVSITALSWFGLGIWYGWGYCPCTEWHWQVRARLGHHDPPSYIQLMIRELFGIDLGPNRANALALVTLTAVAVISILLKMRDWRGARPATGTGWQGSRSR